jgi:hypothetical protein
MWKSLAGWDIYLQEERKRCSQREQSSGCAYLQGVLFVREEEVVVSGGERGAKILP